MSWTVKSIATATRVRQAVKTSEVRLGRCARILVMAITLGAANTASGWIYPEHRDIAVLAVQGLDAERRAEFDRLWQAARAGDPQRMCVVVGATGLAAAGLTGLVAGYLYEHWGRLAVSTTTAAVMAVFLVAARFLAAARPRAVRGSALPLAVPLGDTTHPGP